MVACVQEQQYAQHDAQQGPPGYNPYPSGGDAFMTGFATDMLQQQSATYIQRGQAFMQQRMGFLSTDVMHYFFNLNSEYGAPSFPSFRPCCVQALLLVQAGYPVINPFALNAF